MTRVLGGIADLLSEGPYRLAYEPSAVLGLRANLLTPVMVAANWSLATAPNLAKKPNPPTPPPAGLRHRHGIRGHPTSTAIGSVRRPRRRPPRRAQPGRRNSQLNAAKHALALRKGLSGVTLRTVAADLSAICGAAAATTNAAIALGQLDPQRGRPVVTAISDANIQWREASRWPQTIYLGGARDTALADASIHLRQTIIGTLRDGKTRAAPSEIANRLPRQNLLAVARRAMHAAREAGDLQRAGVTNPFRGADQVMMASRALEDAAYMSNLVFTARRRGTWIPMPRNEPIGAEVDRAASDALIAAKNARQLAISISNSLVSPSEAQSPPVVGLEPRTHRCTRSYCVDGSCAPPCTGATARRGRQFGRRTVARAGRVCRPDAFSQVDMVTSPPEGPMHLDRCCRPSILIVLRIGLVLRIGRSR